MASSLPGPRNTTGNKGKKDLGLGVEIKANIISQIVFPGAFTFSTLSLVFKKEL